MASPFPFDNTYARLGLPFAVATLPTSVAAPQLIAVNEALAAQLGIDLTLVDSGWWAGNGVPPGAQPVALAYAGHQFGHFVPQLGDGRAILLGEVVDENGQRWDIQLKGAGLTPFSRRGDGRAALGPVLREYVVSEAMFALGIPATRALAASTTGEKVARERALPGAVFTRVAASHLRIGSFEYFAARGQAAELRQLADYAIDRYYPECRGQDNPYAAFLAAVIGRQAQLVAHWLAVGFIHGVMNTDNMSIAGETIDFGPCAFLDVYDPHKVFSSIDRQGRYAFDQQAAIGLWNLTRLSETLLPLLGEDEQTALATAQQELERFAPSFQAAYLGQMRRKLGLFTSSPEDADLIADLLAVMAAERADYTLTFRNLGWDLPDSFAPWQGRWEQRLAQEQSSPLQRRAALAAVNPAIIPRNHRIEQAIQAAEEGDFQPFHRLHQALQNPFDVPKAFNDFTLPPRPGEEVLATFCGT